MHRLPCSAAVFPQAGVVNRTVSVLTMPNRLRRVRYYYASIRQACRNAYAGRNLPMRLDDDAFLLARHFDFKVHVGPQDG